MTCRIRRLTVETRGRGFQRIDGQLQAWLSEISAGNGLLHVFIQHTSASLLITENADPDVRTDLETLIRDLAPDGDPRYRHCNEGDDDMSAHFRTVLTQTELTVPVENGQLMLGTWQGVFLWEHRAHAHRRQLVISFLD